MKEKRESNQTRKIELRINGLSYSVEVDANMPLLWVLRDELGLVGTKYGCGAGLCGSCTVMIDGNSVRSCLLRVGSVEGEITTIEGIGSPESPHRLQDIWIKNQVAQCGYCQPGQIISAYNLLAQNSSPNDNKIDMAMSGNICRCGTYSRIRNAIKSASADDQLIKTLQKKAQNNG